VSKITLPESSADPFMTLLVYSDRGAMIAVENIVEIQSYVGASEPQNPNQLFRESKISLRPGHAAYGAEILPGTLMARVKDSADSLPKGVSSVTQGGESWGIVTHLGGVITMIDNVCELHTPTVNTEFPLDAFKDASLDIDNLYSWVWFNHWSRFIERWQDILLSRGYIEESFIDLLKTITPDNKELTETCVIYMRNKMRSLLRDKSKNDPQVLILKAAARRPYAYTTLDILRGRANLQNLLERTVGVEDDDIGDELRTFDESKEVYDFDVPEQILG
jgi:hypothetical protein